MPLSCCAYGCQNRFVKGGPYTFHSFPKDEKLRRLWEISLRRKDFKASNSSKICSMHFTEDCFDSSKLGGTWLKSSSVPTVFNFSNHYDYTKKRLQYPSQDQSSRVFENLLIKEEEDSSCLKNIEGSIKKVILTDKKYKFNKICSKISFVQKPNHYWGVAATDEFIIFSKWSSKYISEKRVVIESDMNVKVFIGDFEVKTFNLMKIHTHYDISDLLEKVDAIIYSQ